MASRVSSPILIGRSSELQRLRAVVDRVRSGHSTTVLLGGEAGLGKTRLVAEFVERARSEDCLVLLGGCIDVGEGAMPFAPVIEALRGLVRGTAPDALDAVLGQGRAELARLVPDLGPLALESTSDLSIGSAQGRLFELLLGMLERLAAKGTVCFVVEDLHWSDRSTRDLLGFLVRNLREARVMLLLTYRTDELHRRHPLLSFLAELGRASGVERVDLRPFDRRESAAQLRAIAGRDLDEALIDSIHARSGGNAFYAEELLVAAEEDRSADLPATLKDVLMARVAQLAEPTQEFLRIASAAGQRVDPALLAVAAALDEATLYEALRECVGRQILVPDPTAGVEHYAFRHALLQEAVYDDLLPGERTRLHSAFARTLETRVSGERTGDHAAELAYHWYAAHDLPRALESSVAAGMSAEARYAFPEAQDQYERALELWDRVPDAESRIGRDRVDLLAAIASVGRFHDPARAVAHVQAAIRLVDESVDPVRAGLLNERLGRYAWIAGQGELSHEAYATAMRLTPAEPPSAARARAIAGLAQILMLAGRFEESRALADEALSLARAVGARDIEGHALNSRGTGRVVFGEVDAAIEDLAGALEIAEEVSIVDDIGRAYANWIWVLDVAGRFEAAVEMAGIGIGVAERLGSMRFFGAHMLCNAADLLYRLGRWDEAERRVLRAEEVNPLGINAILVEELLARLALARGRFGDAVHRLRPLAALAERAVDIQFIEPVRASLAELALWQGRPDDAVAEIRAALSLTSHSPETRIGELLGLGVRASADAAELARARRTPAAEAAALAAGQVFLDAARARHAVVVAERPVLAPLSLVWMLQCDAETTRLHRQPDPNAWAACADAATQMGRPYPAGYARWREAEARLAARGDRELVAASLAAARDIAAAIGAQPLLREVTALAARARIALGRADSTDRAVDAARSIDGSEAAGFGLTVREREVLALVALGRTNRQIGEALFISENTAGVHVSRILGKLDVAGRGEAAAIAYRLGLVEAAPESA